MQTTKLKEMFLIRKSDGTEGYIGGYHGIGFRSSANKLFCVHSFTYKYIINSYIHSRWPVFAVQLYFRRASNCIRNKLSCCEIFF